MIIIRSINITILEIFSFIIHYYWLSEMSTNLADTQYKNNRYFCSFDMISKTQLNEDCFCTYIYVKRYLFFIVDLIGIVEAYSFRWTKALHLFFAPLLIVSFRLIQNRSWKELLTTVLYRNHKLSITDLLSLIISPERKKKWSLLVYI